MNKCMLALIFATSMIASNVALATQEDPSFNEADSLLNSIKNLVDGAQTNKGKPNKPKSSVTKTATVAKTVSEPKEKTPTKEAVRVVDLPPYTKFTFNKTIAIPAYHQGALFNSGSHQSNLKEGVSYLDVVTDATRPKSCVLLSSKNHIMLRGLDSSSTPSYLEVKNISILNHKSTLAMQIDFFPKQAKLISENESISLSLICGMQSFSKENAMNYSVDDISDSVGSLFEMSVPDFIEI